MNLKAPFPWYGGKSNWAPLIWERFGTPQRYIEPFAGSLAVLLAAPEKPKSEIVCDTFSLIVNLWRAIAADPEAVAHYADWPTFHDDLTARHRWLVRWRDETAPRFAEDPDFYDVRAAGWYVWGLSNWIGGGFCSGVPCNQRPIATSNQGVMSRRIPHIGATVGGQGVNAQARGRVHDSRPSIDTRAKAQSRGVMSRLDGIRPDERGERLIPWMQALAERLSGVVILNRSWESAVTPTLLGQTGTSHLETAVLLDPPYKTAPRSKNLYDSDHDGTSDDVAVASYEWAVQHGDKIRIAYCCQDGDFPTPPGWEHHTREFGGSKGKCQNVDCVMFSPACHLDSDAPLFANLQ